MITRENTIKDVTVMNRVKGSDHRLLRCKVNFGIKIERAKLTKGKNGFRVNKAILKEKQDVFQLELRNKFQALASTCEDIDSFNCNLVTIVKESAKKVAGNKKSSKIDKISEQTRQMLQKRREMKQDVSKYGKIEYTELCKTIRKRIRDEIRGYNVLVVQNALQNNKGLKAAKIRSKKGQPLMTAIKAIDGKIITDRREIVEQCAQFYKDLYSSSLARPSISTTERKYIPDILAREVQHAMQQMKNNKAPGEDEIEIDIVRLAGEEICTHLAKLFTSCLNQRQVPVAWNNAVITLLHKKGDKMNIGNYRPISLISHISKLFTKVIKNRIEKQLDANQSREQAGFRQGYSTSDHLQVITQLVEKCNEYTLPLCLVFVDYEKAFDSVEHNGIVDAMRAHGIHETYVATLASIYNNGTSVIKLDHVSNRFPINRGVRQGDTLSPKLFNAGLEQIFRKLDWDSKGISINGERLNHLRFADDIVLIGTNAAEVSDMLNQLNDESKRLGMKINMKKTKAMFNSNANRETIHLGLEEIEIVDEYVYLGQLITPANDNMDEVKRRTSAGWGAFSQYRDILKSKMPMCLKRKLYNQCIQPAMTYGSQTWALNKRMQGKMQTTQRAMERAMIGITRRDRKANEWVREQTGLQDIMTVTRKLKWQWAGHIARLTDNRWTKTITEWIPLEGKRKQARPKLRWVDEIRKCAGTMWMRVAGNRVEWKRHEEAFIL